MHTPICCTCISQISNETTGLCVNDHDDWAEEQDIRNFLWIAKEKAGISEEYVEKAFPHTIPMFKRLAKTAKMKYKQLFQELKQHRDFSRISKKVN